jgi:hypothetical protein
LGLGWCVLDPRYGTALGKHLHGEHRGSVAAAGLEEKGQGPVLPIRSRRARAGVHACALRGVHRRAREGMLATRTRRGA